VEEAKRQELVEEVLSQTLGARVSICCRMQEEMAPEEPPAGGPAGVEGEGPPESLIEEAIAVFGREKIKVRT
jgi:hypothetical protein